MCQFPPTWQFSSNSHVTVFPSSMCIYLHIASASCRRFNTCCGPAVPFSYPYSKDGLFVDTNLQQFRGLYLVKELTTMVKVSKNFTQEQMEDCSGFVFSKDSWHFLWVLCYFGVLWTVATFLIYLKDRLDFLSISWQCRLYIGYEYWKWSALRNRKGLAMMLSQKFVSISKSRSSLLRASMSWWYKCVVQGSLKLIADARMV